MTVFTPPPKAPASISQARTAPIVTDGPFAETKELIAAFWFWQVKSLEEAIEWVKRCPNEGETDIGDPPGSLSPKSSHLPSAREGNSAGKELPRSNGS